jgi:hypothetical protein
VTFNTDQNDPDFCVVGIGLQWGVTELRFDIFKDSWAEQNWKYPPVPGHAGYIGSGAVFAENPLLTYSQIKESPDLLIPFPFANVPRTEGHPVESRDRFFWMGYLADGSILELGKYQLLLAALKPFGMPERLNDWSLYGPYEITVAPIRTNST